MTILGKIGSADLVATVVTQIGIIDESGTINIRAVNRNTADVHVRIAISPSGTTTSSVGAADWIEYDAPVSYGSPLEETGITVTAGEIIFAYSDTSNVSIRAWGMPAQ
jgi:hypothetical protein